MMTSPSAANVAHLGLPNADATARPTRVDRLRDWFASHRRLTVVTSVVVVAILVAPTSMSPVARLTFAIFTIMLSLTALTKANEVVVCSAALGALVLVGGSSVGDAVGSMTSHTVILLIGAFIVAAAAKASGIAERLAFAIGGKARTVDQLMIRITLVLIATAYLVPSTSGRAALMLPVYLAFAERIDERRVRRALAVLFPAVILLSAVASLFGAGAHVVMTELVAGVGAERISFLQWTVYGLPFAIVSSFASLVVVRTMFLQRHERKLPVDLARASTPWTRSEIVVTTVLGALTLCWFTEPFHGVPAWLAAVIGAAVVTIGPFRATTFAEARSSLPLDLLFVMAVTAEAGSALARTGAADWIAITLLGSLVERGGSALLVVLIVGVVSLLAHLVVTSRTARASVLLPVVILVGAAAGLDVTALAYLSTAAAGYCLTTTTSAKPIRVFSTVADGYDEGDLRRLSLRLLPLHAVLLVGFSFYIWPLLGLSLGSTDRAAADGPSTSADPTAAMPWAGVRIDSLGVGPRWAESPTSLPTGEGSVDPADNGSPVPIPPTSPTDQAPESTVTPVSTAPTAPAAPATSPPATPPPATEPATPVAPSPTPPIDDDDPTDDVGADDGSGAAEDVTDAGEGDEPTVGPVPGPVPPPAPAPDDGGGWWRWRWWRRRRRWRR